MAKNDTAAAVKEPKAPKVLTPCTCGCGVEGSGKFRPGHDATLIKRHLDAIFEKGLPTPAQIDKAAGEIGKVAGDTLAIEFEEYANQRVERLEGKQAKADEKAAATAAKKAEADAAKQARAEAKALADAEKAKAKAEADAAKADAAHAKAAAAAEKKTVADAAKAKAAEAKKKAAEKAKAEKAA